MASVRRLLRIHFYFLFLGFTSAFVISPLSPYLVNSFTSVTNATLNHFKVSPNGGVYIGAVSNLYHLFKNFTVQSQVELHKGTINKILDIVPSPVDKLISCGTDLNGTCQLRNLDDISRDVRDLSTTQTLTVAPEDGSAVGLVVEEASKKISLYVAQRVMEEDRSTRRPIFVTCLHKGGQDNNCDDRRTNGISVDVDPGFIIQYVAVFSYEGYTYYVGSQRNDATKPESPIVPKMSRVCHNDESSNLAGFTEITLECRGENGASYNIAKSAVEVNGTLYVAFAKNTPEEGTNFNEGNQSALCMYDMETLEKEFESSIVNCSCDASIRSNSNYLSGGRCHTEPLPCTKAENITCFPPSLLTVNYPERQESLGGLPGFPIIEHSGASFSSVEITQIYHPLPRRVAFIGTTDGILLKVHFDANTTFTGVLYEIIEVGLTVLGDTWINATGETAMFLTEKQLLEVRVANCSQYETCEECIKPGSDQGVAKVADPFCGWCTLEKSCTRYEHCNTTDISSGWLGYNETMCAAITDVMPRNLSTDVESQMVFVTVEHLPYPSGFNYTCNFGSFFTSAATLNEGSLSCLSPGRGDIPRISDGDNVEVNFSISSTKLDIPFVSTLFTFFNCSRITGCGDCVSKWTCDWCIDGLFCTYNRNSTCDNITSLNDDAADLCPLLVPGESFVPSDVTRHREINLTARNLNLTTELLKKKYECVIEADETLQMAFITNASIVPGPNGDYKVTCSSREYSYSQKKQEIKAFLTLRWRNTSVFLDGIYNVTLYKCHVARPDCSRCLSNITTRPEFQCGWCTLQQGYCAVREMCSLTLLRECSNPPRIYSVSPQSSPIEGGTLVVINGTDLGQRFSDILNVSLAGVVCDHSNFSDNYRVGASLTCETGRSSNATRGNVSLFLVNKTEAMFEQFSYNDPRINSFYPLVGPQSGGTLITIRGTDLQTGRVIRARVGGANCDIVEHSKPTIVCRNGRLAANATLTQNQTVYVTFDGNRKVASQMFVYHEDPTITNVEPLRAIISGGNLLTITGERFRLIQKPKILFSIDGNNATEECLSDDGNEMTLVCRSPSIETLLEQRGEESTAEGTVNVGFIMDGVTELLQWSQYNGVVFEYFKDPEYETFEVRDHPKSSNNLLTLNGKNLNVASLVEDVTVFIGTEVCPVKSLHANTLICELPPEQPASGDLYRNRKSTNLPFIIVQHANLEFNIGYIRYTNAFAILWYVIPGMVAFVIVIAIILVVTVCCIRKKKTEKIRDLELQVRNIQESVSADLKTLFATLQTTMHDFETAIIDQMRAPLLDKRQYLLNMMFLGMKVKPSSFQTQAIMENSNTKAAMEEFSKLLDHKSFLRVLITTLDTTTGISVMDRVNAGSLLSICLLQNGKLELYTDLLLKLMQGHIEECDSKAKQRILFSRNDTMLEKMISNWVVIFLYNFLQEKGAPQVYRLYEAIKYVCELGPIDVVSGKSQFSINDQQMLETQISFKEVKLDVITNSVSGEKSPLKVLDVNTVTQVKERIISYKHRDQPYSQRPLPFSLDLMWRAGQSGQLILRDDDNLPGSAEEEWKKINTLKDLNVPSDSTFELVAKQKNPNANLYENEEVGQEDGEVNRSYINSLEDDDYEKYQHENGNAASNYETLQSKRKTYDVNVRNGVRVWHLVKEDQGDFFEECDEENQRPQKEIKEVVLPFLPATRNYIQKYLDNLINTIFAADDVADVPLSIKYLFEFFDREAEKQGKLEIAKTWKNNVLPLRYWSTIVANPQYVLDVGVYTYTHASLRTLVQVIKDICVGRFKVYKKKDFSPSRLLYSTFLEGYRSKLVNYYLVIRNLGRVNSEDYRHECKTVEQEFQDTFDLTSTHQKLFSFVADHQQELIDALQEDDVCNELSLAKELQKVLEMMKEE